jgi:hypothetical protein
MKTLRTLGLSGLALAAIALPVLAGINSKIGGASHSLEDYSTQLHTYLHHHYTESFGSHDMEVAADELHTTAHHFSNGEATEGDVLAGVDNANAAFADMTAQFEAEGFLSGQNQDHGAKTLYHKVHKYLVLVNAYSASAN